MKCIVIVTYNRKDMLLKNVACIVAQKEKADSVIIVDNYSTDGTQDLIETSIKDDLEKAGYSFQAILLHENTGGAGGFYEGIKTAYELGYDWIWGMDDDAFPEPDAFKALSIAQEKHESDAFWSNCDEDYVGYKDGLKSVFSWMFVGFYINRRVIEYIGLPRNDFFIYHDDSEYANRIINSGMTILKVKDSIIRHRQDFYKDDNTEYFYIKRVCSKNLSYAKMSDWKLYYFVRNGILKYKFSDLNYYKSFGAMLQLGIKILFVNKAQFPIYLKAIIHALFHKTGKRVSP